MLKYFVHRTNNLTTFKSRKKNNSSNIFINFSVSYSYLQDAQTLQIEGTGFIKMQDNKSYPITFKFNRQQLIELQNGEVGNLVNFLFYGICNLKI